VVTVSPPLYARVAHSVLGFGVIPFAVMDEVSRPVRVILIALALYLVLRSFRLRVELGQDRMVIHGLLWNAPIWRRDVERLVGGLVVSRGLLGKTLHPIWFLMLSGREFEFARRDMLRRRALVESWVRKSAG